MGKRDGSQSNSQIYQPPVTKYRKEVGLHQRKKSEKPMKQKLKSNRKVKALKSNMNKAGDWLIYLISAVIVLLLAWVFKINFVEDSSE